MNREVWIGVVVTALIVGAFVYFRYGALWTAEPEAPPAAAPPPVAAPHAGPPPIRHPVPDAAAEPDAPPLPALEDSDEPFHDAVAELLGRDFVAQFLVRSRIIHKIVATVDSLDKAPVPLRIRPVTPVPGALEVDAADDTITLKPSNAKRYEPVIAALQAADAERVARLYLRYYPLFQKAYEDLGYPDRYFNDRLIEIIDHLLATPEPEGPLRLIRPKVLYQYADPEIERRSSGQKALIRIGTDNARAVKSGLEELRAVIVRENGSAAP